MKRSLAERIADIGGLFTRSSAPLLATMLALGGCGSSSNTPAPPLGSGASSTTEPAASEPAGGADGSGACFDKGDCRLPGCVAHDSTAALVGGLERERGKDRQ